MKYSIFAIKNQFGRDLKRFFRILEEKFSKSETRTIIYRVSQQL